MVLELGVSLEASSLSPGIEVRLAYILPSPYHINSFAIGGIILGMVVVHEHSHGHVMAIRWKIKSRISSRSI
ncbi:hypothetical protein HanPSC8_Chr16g0731861 [Helianthus annuus]|nr:hypothetical protein HanPSC8_Chr16g0731861 [Helianthus annuus]